MEPSIRVADTYPTDQIYWPGNVAKSRIVSDILARSKGNTVVVLDYGSGKGGDWPSVLGRHSNIILCCYEPNEESRAILKSTLAVYPTSRIIDERELSSGAIAADFIVSLSVLEHVYDRQAYLGAAAMSLKSSGLFYLNYDDGHFRNVLDLSRSETWIPAIRAQAAYRLAKLRHHLGLSYKYICPVQAEWVFEYVQTLGLEVIDDRYENIECMKSFCKGLSDEQQKHFRDIWLEVETQINRHFIKYSNSKLDRNAWRLMSSRTLLLQRKDATR